MSNRIPSFQQLGLVIPEEEEKLKLDQPRVLERLCMFDQGIILLAGEKGSGKSTTTGAMLNYRNILVSDRFLFPRQTNGFMNGTQDPAIILVGELRDRESYESAVHAAQTGHLVFATIHASSAAGAISLILDLFPPDMHTAVRQGLTFSLKAVICQKLVPSLKWDKRLRPVLEIMIANAIVRNLILNKEDGKVQDAIRCCYNEGMIDFNEHLRQLVLAGDIGMSTALAASPNPNALMASLDASSP